MKTAGMVIIAVTVLGILSSVLQFAVVRTGLAGPALMVIGLLRGQIGWVVWIFIGVGFIALDNRLGRLERRLPRPPRMQNVPLDD
jgi:hypothetical protein